jgi:lysine/ornithine N-monooxygenase
MIYRIHTQHLDECNKQLNDKLANTKTKQQEIKKQYRNTIQRQRFGVGAAVRGKRRHGCGDPDAVQ